MTDLSVEKIESMEREALVALWREMFSDPIPWRASASFMRYVLAFDVQGRKHGSLPAGFVCRLNKFKQLIIKKYGHAFITRTGAYRFEQYLITLSIDLVDWIILHLQ